MATGMLSLLDLPILSATLNLIPILRTMSAAGCRRCSLSHSVVLGKERESAEPPKAAAVQHQNSHNMPWRTLD